MSPRPRLPQTLHTANTGSVPFRRLAQIDRPDDERNRNHDGADHRERPEDIDIGKQVDLLTQGLPNPGDRLRCSVGCVRSLRLEITRHSIDRLLISDIGRNDVLDQTVLMKLLALCQDGLHQRDA